MAALGERLDFVISMGALHHLRRPLPAPGPIRERLEPEVYLRRVAERPYPVGAACPARGPAGR